MTEALFRDDAYLRETRATVLSAEPRGIALDRTVFYPQGGGQPGDQGVLVLDDGETIAIVNTIYDADRKTILHAPAEGAALPAAGASVTARIDWDRRFRRMRAHTALHLLSVVLPYPASPAGPSATAKAGSTSTARRCWTRPRWSAGSTSSSRSTRR